jgi:demethylmenaquinone methyltransferase / 2-methoxy-6-polyprenyl-1,4-benzoquinol methylase
MSDNEPYVTTDKTPGTALEPVAPTALEKTGAMAPERVRAMFERIAGPYDLMNRAMTLGLDQRWRKLAAAETGVGGGASVLDCCCGTGDLAFALAELVGPSGEVIGVDFAPAMLERARAKAADRGVVNVDFVEGDALELPLPDRRVAAATVGFGIRNVADVEQGFRELVRVVRPGGRVVCLEITTPQDGPLRPFYRFWFDRLVPLVGRAADSSSAYSYLPASVRRFPPPQELGAIMFRAGLTNVRYRILAGGIVALHYGEVPVRR